MTIQFDSATDAFIATTNANVSVTVGNLSYGHMFVNYSAYFLPGTPASDANATAMTYGGDALALYGEFTNRDSDVVNQIWTLPKPRAGTNTLNVISNKPTADNRIVCAATFDNVDPTSPIKTVADTCALGTDVSVNIVTSPGDYVVDFLAGGRATTNATLDGPYVDQTLRASHSVSSNMTNTAGISTMIADAASETMGWLYYNTTVAVLVAVALNEVSPARARTIAYFHDINDPGGRIYDNLGRVVYPWELKPNNWIRVTGLFLPTSRKYASHTKDPELAFIEEVSFTLGGGLKIKTSRGEITEVLLARAAGGKTL